MEENKYWSGGLFLARPSLAQQDFDLGRPAQPDQCSFFSLAWLVVILKPSPARMTECSRNWKVIWGSISHYSRSTWVADEMVFHKIYYNYVCHQKESTTVLNCLAFCQSLL